MVSGQLAALGISPRCLRDAVSRGEVVGVRRGAYVAPDRVSSELAYARRARAILHSRPPGEALSHHAALAVRGLPLLGVDLHRVDLLGNVQRTTLQGVARIRPIGDHQIALVADARCVDVATALVQVSISSGRTAAVVAADQAVRHGLCSTDDLATAAGLRSQRAHRRLAAFLAAVDPGSESVGETRARLILRGAGLGVVSQQEIRDPDGQFVARVDLLVEGVAVVEFDGVVKYVDADGSGRVLFAEKLREDRIRSLGYVVVRVTWADLANPARLLARVRAAVEAGHRWREACGHHAQS